MTRLIRFVILIALLGTLGQSVLSRTQQTHLIDGNERLASVTPLPDASGEFCPPETLMASLQQPQQNLRAASRPNSNILERPPVRTIRDSRPTYSAVAVDTQNNEIVLQDENLFEIMVYDRTANTPANAAFSEPKRVIAGLDTKVEFNCGLYIDPKSGDIYSINNDTIDTMVVFSRNAKGNVRPNRELSTPHRTYGIAVDEHSQELFLTIQDPPMVVVHHKNAEGDAEPVRVLRGNKTGLRDAHGIGLDTKNGWMFVANYGSSAVYEDGGGNSVGDRNGAMIRGSGTFHPPSITVYPIKASGDTAPLRTIEGPDTHLNWPAHIYVDEDHGELFVANDSDDSIVVFHVTDSGNIHPIRTLKGANTQLKNPTGIFVDTLHNELVVSNMGNHRATIYSRTADGNTAPLRVIRSAPEGKHALMIGNPGSVAYDSKREEILVPN